MINTDEFKELSDEAASETIGHEPLHVASNDFSNYLRASTNLFRDDPTVLTGKNEEGVVERVELNRYEVLVEGLTDY